MTTYFEAGRMILLCVFLLAFTTVGVFSLSPDKNLNTKTTPNPHGGIPHGIKNPACDNNVWYIEVDWNPFDSQSSRNYTCAGPILDPDPVEPLFYCQTREEEKPPIHVCYPHPIHYEDDPPMSGAHRPLWPVYGEYKFLPPQRWVHSLEHGAVVLLYHPCADKDEVAVLRKIVTSCIRKHIITPYDLPRDRPLALVTWGCRLMMSFVDYGLAKSFIKRHALQARESAVIEDGQYGYFLIKPARVVSTIEDDNICPDKPKPHQVHSDYKPKIVDELNRVPVAKVKIKNKRKKVLEHLLDSLTELKKLFKTSLKLN